MSAKKVSFGTKPKVVKPDVDDWVETRTTASEVPVDKSVEAAEKMKRLTLDIPESLHRAIKGKAVVEGRTMVEMLRELLEDTYG
ncbi:hypothetical protein ACSYAD_27460 [Acaryochloris marina NIES-2412]|uniref:hypothetical protein n=1 Tax=Acaryochloris marina TaxID=155978 RepID=UPI00405A2FCA